ncbi:hypothetical protein BIW53_20040 [Pseudoalteromonas byunsanensis]|uniref:Uncharacterized protein n=1 Tax=Pseudoalteromonas byunsanensis TaxID=327939 RepID=A0A1S1N2M4_9GAMM|nr:hypothetical protein BIW53_20040 [Pseudoalteromonas byunsanensis]
MDKRYVITETTTRSVTETKTKEISLVSERNAVKQQLPDMSNSRWRYLLKKPLDILWDYVKSKISGGNDDR